MNKQRQYGFTLVEFTVSLLAAAVLCLTMGCLLYYNYKTWTQLQAVAELQRDASLAMNTMNRVIRGGSATNMWWVGASSYLVVNDTNNVEGWRFTRINDRLSFSVGGQTRMDLVRKGVTGFTCNLNSTNMVVWLSVAESSTKVSLSLTNTIYPRN